MHPLYLFAANISPATDPVTWVSPWNDKVGMIRIKSYQCNKLIPLKLFSAANLALAGFPLTNALGGSMPSPYQFWFFLAGGGERGQWGKLFGNATFAGRNWRLTAQSNKICCGETFSVFNWFKPNLVCLLGNRVNDHPPTLTKIGQL